MNNSSTVDCAAVSSRRNTDFLHLIVAGSWISTCPVYKSTSTPTSKPRNAPAGLKGNSASRWRWSVGPRWSSWMSRARAWIPGRKDSCGTRSSLVFRSVRRVATRYEFRLFLRAARCIFSHGVLENIAETYSRKRHCGTSIVTNT